MWPPLSKWLFAVPLFSEQLNKGRLFKQSFHHFFILGSYCKSYTSVYTFGLIPKEVLTFCYSASCKPVSSICWFHCVIWLLELDSVLVDYREFSGCSKSLVLRRKGGGYAEMGGTVLHNSYLMKFIIILHLIRLEHPGFYIQWDLKIPLWLCKQIRSDKRPLKSFQEALSYIICFDEDLFI